MKQKGRPFTTATVGDVYAVNFGESLWGAVRVLRISAEDRHTLLAVTPWLGSSVPDISEPLLRAILWEQRGRPGSHRHAICWYEGSVPAGLMRVGNVLPTAEELAIPVNGRFGGDWIASTGSVILLERELREHYDRLMTRIRAELKRPSHAVAPLDDGAFWRLIGTIDRDAVDGASRVKPLVNALSQLQPEQIIAFQRALDARLSALDSVGHREAFEREHGSPVSEDHFEDVRLAVIASGERYFAEILSHPERLPSDKYFEELGAVADQVYRSATGKRMP